MMQSMGDNLSHKKVIFILSPQWFVKNGVSNDYFDAYYSDLQAYQWVSNLKQVTADDAYLAKRLLEFPKVKEDERLSSALKNISEEKMPDALDRQYLTWMFSALSREDELFGKIGMISKNKAITKATKDLPAQYNLDDLTQLATEIGEKSTNNNQFEISNSFYTKRLKKNIAEFENSQTKWDYRYSPEYSDLQLVLSQLAHDDAEVLFIIPPVNKHWSDYTGLSQEMLQGFAKKVKYQLTSQGFNNIADFTQNDAVPYFMADTIHLGWRGWLEADQWIQPFLENKSAGAPNYQLNSKFYSKEWQEKDPGQLNK